MMNQRSDETEALWRQFRDRMFSYIRRRVDRVDDAEDILQEVFLRVHAKADRLAEVDNIAGWIYRIAANAIVDHGRSRARSQDTISHAAAAASDGRRDDHGSTAAASELARCLEPLLQSLPASYRDAVTMTDLHGMTQPAAAAQLGLTVSGMKARVQRGRQQLRNVLGNCCEVELDRRRGVIDYRRRDGGDCGDPPR